MSRRKRVYKKEERVDSRYGSPAVARLISTVMKRGKKSPYSMDANLLHISFEGRHLENPSAEAEESMWRWTVSPEAAPDAASLLLDESEWVPLLRDLQAALEALPKVEEAAVPQPKKTAAKPAKLPAGYQARLRKDYDERIAKAMTEKFGYKNRLEVPRLDKIVINMGLGEATSNAKLADVGADQLMNFIAEHFPAPTERGPAMERQRVSRARMAAVASKPSHC